MATNDVTASPWLVLKDAIQKILLDNKAFTNYSIPELFQCTFKMANDSQSENVYNELKDLITEHLEKNVRTKIVNISSASMLSVLCNMWDDFQSSIDSISRILIYFEGFNDKINPNNQNISKMSNGLFSNLIVHYDNILDTIRALLLGMLNDDRDGIKVNREEFKKILTIMMSLEAVLDGPTPVNEIPTVYDIEFIPTLLDVFSSFINAEGKKLVTTSGYAIDYITSAESLIAQEEVRIKHYFDEKTQIKLKSIMNINLVQLYMDAIVELKSDVKYMIENREDENLRCMYNFLNRVDDGLKPMIKYLNSFVTESGKLIVQGTNIKAADFIKGLMDLNITCNYLLVNCFNDDLRVKCNFTESFKFVVELNPMAGKYLLIVVIESLKTMLRSVEKHCSDTVILEALKIYDYLQDKNSFENSLKLFIARMLFLNYLNSSVLNDKKTRLLSILKDNCGHEFSTEVDNMVNDIDTQSKTTMDEFKQHAVQSKNHFLLSVDNFNAFVLNKAYWPPFESISCKLPLELSSIYDNFKEYHKNKYNKQLSLLHRYGLIDLKTVFYGSSRSADRSLASGSSKEYTIQVSTMQTCVLLLFNNCHQLTLEDILKETDIPKHCLIPVLKPLASNNSLRSNILTKYPPYTEFQLTDKLSINEAFISHSHTVIFHDQMMKLTRMVNRKGDIENMDKTADKLINLFIVRIMTLKKKMTHSALMNEVKKANINLNPTTHLIKYQIEKLIKRKFMKKLAGDVYVCIST